MGAGRAAASKRCLGRCQLRGADVEVMTSAGFGAEDAFVELDDVEVDVQDSVLGQEQFQPDGKPRLPLAYY